MFQDMHLKAELKSLFLRKAPRLLLQYVKKRYYLKVLKLQNESDEPEFKVIKALVGSGETVIDVGANIGRFTCYLARLVGERGVVHSIEPIPLTYEILSNSVRKLGLDHVRLWNFAASDRHGTAMMEIPKYEAGGTENFYQARIVPDGKREVSLRRYQIDLRSLDSLPDIPVGRSSFIKIDVEGHELEVIKGAAHLISASKPSMLIEISGNLEEPTSAASELSRCLEKEGYRPYWLDGDRLRIWRKGTRCINYFYLTKEHLGKVEKFLEMEEKM